MWRSLARLILGYGYVWLALLIGLTAYLGWQASKVQLSYEFSRAIPTDNPKYRDYQEFRKKFGEDGNLLVVGIQTPNIFEPRLFADYTKLSRDIRKVNAVEDVVSMPSAIYLAREEASEKLQALPVFPDSATSPEQLDSNRQRFLSLPFYRGLLYNAETGAWMMGVRINGQVLNSKARSVVVDEIVRLSEDFGKKHNIEVRAAVKRIPQPGTDCECARFLCQAAG